jgi:hypothetical protein
MCVGCVYGVYWWRGWCAGGVRPCAVRVEQGVSGMGIPAVSLIYTTVTQLHGVTVDSHQSGST